MLHALALALTQRATAALGGAWRRCDPLPVRSFRDAFDAFADGFFLGAPSSMRGRGTMHWRRMLEWKRLGCRSIAVARFFAGTRRATVTSYVVCSRAL